ncbi:uncharacterized protein BHQ10_007198 [Talaromyces amestolkiae]|uniref:MOSC domain-containing protein n=1 Tax=Talaromyces amestolkiae TaxID=1196081 RepID=A0A364L5W2_TALAM|nr:uncharacterized protein BHQ10_007198 [Talaromyces amestolkiae]RAO71186.1 hypothetical protein BHQ10_007198 [Talaromyces amestolkiae]
MRYTTLATGALALISSTTVLAQTASTTLPTAASTSTSQAASQLDTLSQYAYNVSTDGVDNSTTNKRSGCSLSNLKIRREWSTFSTKQKKAYINAVLCLQSKPSKTPSDLVPGAKTRYDDFVATHINQTLEIHYTGTFLAWHRYFTWEFEQTLINECGYTGTIPYWNWPAAANSLETYPVFDGSDTSMSGNGVPRGPNDTDSDIVLSLAGYADIYLPLGTGGGCVTSGPFVNYTVNLGPVALALPGGESAAAANPLDYNPRCLKRDLTTALIQQYANFTSVVSLILNNADVADFQLAMQGVPGSGAIGVHGGGHYSMGGDPGRDVFVSPGDPAFWLHHGMIDRVWWIWQNLDLAQRQNAISGTGTFLNYPPSANTTLDTLKNNPEVMKMYISELYVYPIKSLQPTKLQEATVTRHGILYDRCFMLLKVETATGNDDHNSGIETERTKPTLRNMHVPHFPQMSLFFTDLVLPDDDEQQEKKIIVTYQEPPVSENKPRRTLVVPLEPDVDGLEKIPVTMHQSPMMGYVMGKKYNDWFSECFGFQVVLTYTGMNRRRVLGSMNPNIARQSDQRGGWLSTLTSYVPLLGAGTTQERDEEILTFADCASYMVVNEKSVKDVASRFQAGEGRVEVTRFRPNVVVGGAENAWEEDFWSELSVATDDDSQDVQLILTSNCIRCRSLDVDFETGDFHKTDDGIIYKKLNKDRRVDKGAIYKPVFGRYGFLKDDVVAKVRVGDAVTISKKAEERTVFDWPGL